jgi:hypothetical protein
MGPRISPIDTRIKCVCENATGSAVIGFSRRTSTSPKQKLFSDQWRLVGFIVEEANLNKHSNNKYTIIIIFLNKLYRVSQNAYQYVVK